MNISWSEADLNEIQFFSDDEAVDLLKQIYFEERSLEETWLESDKKNKFQKALEASLLERNSAKIEFNICRYGVSATEVFNRRKEAIGPKNYQKYYSDSHYLAALHNELFVAEVWLNQLFPSLIKDYPKSKAYIEALASNQAFKRDTITKLLENRKDLSNFTDPDFLNFFSELLLKCPALLRPYDDTILDGFGDYYFGKLNHELYALLSEIEPSSENVPTVLNLSKISFPISSTEKDEFEKIIFKWRDTKFDSNLMKDNKDYNYKYFQVRNAIASKYLSFNSYHTEKCRDFYEAHKLDPAVRYAFYRNATIKSLLTVNDHDVGIPAFKSYVDTKAKEIPSNVKEKLSHLLNMGVDTLSKLEIIEMRILNFFCLDGNKFIEELAFNGHFYLSTSGNALVQKLGWDLALDPSSQMDVTNTIRHAQTIFKKQEQPEKAEIDANRLLLEEFENSVVKQVTEIIKKEQNIQLGQLSSFEKKSSELAQKYERHSINLTQKIDSTNYELDNLIAGLSDSERLLRDSLQEVKDENIKIYKKNRRLILLFFCIFCIMFILNLV
jgi:hypothetical protein